MPWTTPFLNQLVNEARSIITAEFSTSLTAKVFICSETEMREVVINGQLSKGVPEKILSAITEQLEYIVGKYFEKNNTIWLVELTGENLETLIHEFLHSIQKCSPRREGIVDYLTFKLTKNIETINTNKLTEWQEIERTIGFRAIKKKLLTDGDCEDF